MKTWPNISGALDDYVDANWLRESPLKLRLREETAKMRQAGMQISAHQGQQMALLARTIGARRAVEVGTFTGYSALCVAEALGPAGKLWWLRRQRGMTRIARRYWKEAGLDMRMSSPSARPCTTLDGLLAQGSAASSTWPSSTPTRTITTPTTNAASSCVRRGGLVLIDNVLWGGSVANLAENDADTRAIRALNAKLRKDERVDLALLAVGDGMTCALKR
jgi:predicted O-methyltransferase YrrM